MLRASLRDVPQYRAMPAALLRGWMVGQNAWANGITHDTPSGFLCSAPGAPAHTVAHVGMLSLMFAATEQRDGKKTVLAQSVECFALKLATSLLGGPFGNQPSYVVGYGPRWPKRIYHRQASCRQAPVSKECSAAIALLTTQANPYELTGALVAGPDASGAYGDNRTLPGQSGVSLDGNAVLSGLLAGLIARDVQPGQCNGGRGFVQNFLTDFLP